MKALLWKEFRERRVWGLVWAISIISVLGTLANWYGHGIDFTLWVMLPVALSFLAGGTAYSSELKESRMDFIYSQPIPWAKLLFAKALFGFVVALVSTALAAILFSLCCPDYYSGYASTPALVKRVAILAWWIWSLYLSGMFFSVVMPGIVGSVSVFIICLLPLALTSALAYEYLPRERMDMFEIGKSCALLIGPGMGTLILLRFGLSLTPSARAARYGLVALAALVTIPGLFMLIPKDFVASKVCHGNCDWSSISPKGNYALVHYEWRLNMQVGIMPNSASLREGYYMTRFSDGKIVPIGIDLPKDSDYFWASDNTAYFYSPNTASVQFLRLLPSGKLTTWSVKTNSSQPRILPSPNGRLAMLASQGPKGTTLELLDTEGAKQLDSVAHEAAAYWWQSDRQICYLDVNGGKHSLSL